MFSNYLTPYVECNSLLALLAGDERAAAAQLDTLSEGERSLAGDAYRRAAQLCDRRERKKCGRKAR